MCVCVCVWVRVWGVNEEGGDIQAWSMEWRRVRVEGMPASAASAVGRSSLVKRGPLGKLARHGVDLATGPHGLG